MRNSASLSAISARRIALSALLPGLLASCAASSGSVADAGADRVEAGRGGEHFAQQARTLIGRGKPDRAVSLAEQAVAATPDRAEYRALLGKAYLKAGRFTSAGAALDDALALNPGDGDSALSLALARIATGEADGAISVLTTYQAVIRPGDLGLALALAGDTDSAIPILSAVARGPKASPTARQNLALALALGGHWREAKAIASIDVSPDQLDTRIAQWAALSKPGSAADRIAALLNVTPVNDPGQPVRLALARQSEQMVAQASVAPTEADSAPEPRSVPDAVGSTAEAVAFAKRQEVVQPLPASTPEHRGSAPLSKGSYYVQLGAFENAGTAEVAWRRIVARHTAIGGMKPMGAYASVGGRDFYRLSVGGFAREAANRLCADVRAGGGRCFVRANAGERLARWVREADAQLAAR